MPNDFTPTFFNELDDTPAHAWALLARGVADRRSAFHTPTLITQTISGAPAARTVVLRACDVPARTLRFHTDERSAKVAEIERMPRVIVHGYDFKSKAQLRLEGHARVMEASSDAARAAWLGSQESSRMIYAQTHAPGAPINAPAQGDGRDGAAEENFSIIMVVIDAFEWLYLHHAGHRRARFAWQPEGWRGQWLAP